MYVLEGEPFVVPAEHVLVVKTLASAEGSLQAVLEIDGVTVLSAGDPVTSLAEPLELELGIAARAGQTVTVASQSPDPDRRVIALGYLARL